MTTYDEYPDPDFRIQDREDGTPVLVRPMTDAAREWAQLHLPAPNSNGTIEITGSLQSVTVAMADDGLIYRFYWKNSHIEGI